MELNKLRTPPRNLEKITHDEDKYKILLAEIYTQNKQIEKLHIELEDKNKNEQLVNKQLNELENMSNEKISKLIIEVNEQKCFIDDIVIKYETLIKAHNYNELIEFYENKIKEFHNKNISNVKMFTKMLDKISIGANNINTNRDDVWRNLIKKYESKITELETKLFDINEKERKINCRQKFFEKYCFKAEERIEKFSKISKKFYDQENKISELKSEILKYQCEFKQKINESDNKGKVIEKLKTENNNFKNFVNKIKPILKLDWEEISKNNEENFFNIIKNSSNEEYNYNSKNIILLIDNLNNFIFILEKTFNEKIVFLNDLSPIRSVVDDIKNYTIMLLKKIQQMTINQYHIINICCDLNDKIVSHVKNNKVSFNFLSIMKDIRNSCSKLLFDFSPK